MSKPWPTMEAPARDGSGGPAQARASSARSEEATGGSPRSAMRCSTGQDGHSGQPVGGQKKNTNFGKWKTTLPFPVQVVSRVEVIDEISKGKLTTRYFYHHGHWDGGEREFRGFGRVDQFDTETFERYNDPSAALGVTSLQGKPPANHIL